jgi:hypothetical protein
VDTRDDETAELWRTVVRVVLADVAGQILLLNLVEPKYPELGDCWELPGGIDPGEDVFMGRAARAGDALRIPVTDIAAPRWFRFVTFLHAGARRIQDEAMPTPPSRPSSPSDHPQRRRERDLPRVQLVDNLAATSLALYQISDSLRYPAQREGLVDNCCHLAGLHELPHDLQVPAVLASNSASVTAGRAAATRSTSCSIPSLRCLSSLHPTDWLEPFERVASSIPVVSSMRPNALFGNELFGEGARRGNP